MVVRYIFLLVFVTSTLSCIQKSENDIVRINNRQVLVNEVPYVIKGICYNPVPIGTGKRDFGRLDEDLDLMKKAGINTIRVYAPIEEKWVLDKIDAAGLKVIIGFGYNQAGYYDILSGSFINYVNKFKQHNAILFWELGNEYNYHPEWFNGEISNWYQALNLAACMIHENDAAHPVSTAHGELPDSLALAQCPDIDVWGMNVYRWDVPAPIFEEWQAISQKPMYLSEAGADSYMTIAKDGYEQGPNQQAQADATRQILEDVMMHSNICSGVTLFAFNDEWWKAGDNNSLDPGGFAPESSGVPYDGTANEEYWGIVDINRQPKAAYHVVAEMYVSIDN
ncbi:hypothetical protein KEM09_20875 [Carboxylicivirga mesophila]|uniref:Glycoside hydrolase family 2 catalytic domain-containing protein n=1 Tax=Carboxylicivirga mesophila TaxID=1166478 RepID=A0ABS5KFV3_9BACT|nr:glycoside hydrolase family 2 TIM barrel-domain containing protein [Carboxylicivirga mesophila]MBS2213875.1 hypothetical protein [Carboxylicivirga mesophila]